VIGTEAGHEALDTPSLNFEAAAVGQMAVSSARNGRRKGGESEHGEQEAR
jgi:hypothetical protein